MRLTSARRPSWRANTSGRVCATAVAAVAARCKPCPREWRKFNCSTGVGESQAGGASWIWRSRAFAPFAAEQGRLEGARPAGSREPSGRALEWARNWRPDGQIKRSATRQVRRRLARDVNKDAPATHHFGFDPGVQSDLVLLQLAARGRLVGLRGRLQLAARILPVRGRR